MFVLLFLLFSNANADFVDLDIYDKSYGNALQGEQGCVAQEGVEPFCINEWSEDEPVHTDDCPAGRSFFSIASESQCRLYFIHTVNIIKESYSEISDTPITFSFKVESNTDAPGRPRCDVVASNEIYIDLPEEADDGEGVLLAHNFVGVFRPENPLQDADACAAAASAAAADDFVCTCTVFDADSAAAEVAKLPKLPEPDVVAGVTGTGAQASADPKTWIAVGLASLIILPLYF